MILLTEGRRPYNEIKDSTRASFTKGEVLRFEKDVWSRYYEQTGYFFIDLKGEQKACDISDSEPID